MKQLLKQMSALTAAAVLCLGCQKENSDNANFGDYVARIAFNADTYAEVVTRNTIDLKNVVPASIPMPQDFMLFLKADDVKELTSTKTGDGDNIVETGTTFNYSESWLYGDYPNPPLYPGDYVAEIVYGDPDAIGRKLPYFYGKVNCPLTRQDIGTTKHYKITASLQNAMVRISADQLFNDYFTDASFHLIVDGQGTGIELTFSGENAEPVFVPAGSSIELKGTVRRPSQTNLPDDLGELLEVEVPARTMAANTLYTFKFTAQSGGVNVTVKFESPEEGTTDHDPEMNDEA